MLVYYENICVPEKAEDVAAYLRKVIARIDQINADAPTGPQDYRYPTIDDKINAGIQLSLHALSAASGMARAMLLISPPE